MPLPRPPAPDDQPAPAVPRLRLVHGEESPRQAFAHRPLFFNEIEIGDEWRSSARTLTETDLVMFAGLTGDFDPLHTDHEFARNTPFGRPIAHGLFGMSLVAGLGSHSPWMRTVAFTRILDWRFMRPMFVGDTVAASTRVLAKTPHGRRHGLVTWLRQLVNQSNEVVQEGTVETMVQLDPEVARALRSARKRGSEESE